MDNSIWFREENLLMPMEALTKEEVITKLGNLLFENGYVKESFVPAVLAREKEFATGLPLHDIGVAIPHTDAEHVLKPAVAVGLLTDPVKFCEMGDLFDSEIDVSLILMLAVPDKDKVMTVLNQVMSLIQDPNFLTSLLQSPDRLTVVQLLEQRLNSECCDINSSSPTGEGNSGSKKIRVVVSNQVGLHARPATQFVKVAKEYEAEIMVRCGVKAGDAKSILGILALGVNQGSEIIIQADGYDADQALAALKGLVESNFGEE